ncbi:uncharacterized protein TRIVIDRAFT_199076 [Trichoderma virens Gv29-8]|uniref:Myb-like domain-containing protein n=1 Tax=Hypocrea virens (strain Gv29-8 / FGSC 10586) TaxID=413071 RepID=G9MM94_HYPVG|nr:uncharacterized protein TRIVIDRAFT_199076 [Trichoderma virens Gv29-8]EHK24463.1 hypothetical protein TRIVIDRAFT_199076 [Trichoderma virens Gv29-8]
MSGTTPFSNAGIEIQYLNKSAIPRSPYTQKMNPIFAGLITPPESPVRYVQRESLEPNAPQSPALSTSESTPRFSSTNEVQKAMEALSAAIRIANEEKVDQHANLSEAVSTPVTPIDFNHASEIIHSIIEQAVEEKMANAMGPLRLNINKLDDSVESLRREHTDIHDQNDTMSRQLDLHYRTVEQHVEEFRSQSKTMNTMIGAQADNFAATINMVNHLSQVVTNLPLAINQVVHNAVQQQTQLAIRDIMFAQQQAMFSVSDVSGTRQSMSSDGNSSQCTCNHHCLEIESMVSSQHGSGSLKQISPNASSNSSRGFRYALRKLFKSNRCFQLQFIAAFTLLPAKMGTPQGKKTTPKKGQTAAHNRRSPSKALKAEQTPNLDKLKTPSSTPRETAYTHNLPTDEQKKGNGRVTGRSLIMWNRPRMAEKLLLHIHYECARHKVNVPWDAIAHRLHPGSSGQAVLQHVNRLRKELLSEGHMVPPLAHKTSPSAPYDPTIRGYVRDLTSDDKLATRSVGFDEKLDDAKINLPDALDALEEDDGDFFTEAIGEVSAEANADFTVLEDDIQFPVTPTPVRHAAPRRPVSTPHYSMKPQSLQQVNTEATQQLFDPNLFANISPPNFLLDSIEGFQPMGIQTPATFANESQLLMGGDNLFDPFITQPLIKPSHGQISPSGQMSLAQMPLAQMPLGQMPLDQVQQPFFMGNPFSAQLAGYSNLVQSSFMPHPPYGFTMPPTTPTLFKTEQKEEPLSAPVANNDRGISVSPVSSPIAAQLPPFQPETLQPVIESPEQNEVTAENPYADDFAGHELLLEFLASE